MGEVSQVSVDNWAQQLDWEWRRRGRVRGGCKDCIHGGAEAPMASYFHLNPVQLLSTRP